MEYVQLYPTNDYSDMSIVVKNCEKNLAELKRIDSAQPDGSILYRYYRENVADGEVYYQVVKVNKTTCLLKVCSGICLDEWDKGYYSVKRSDIERRIDARIGLEKLLKK